MLGAIKTALLATLLTSLSLGTFRQVYPSTDLAVLALLPLAVAIAIASWTVIYRPWRATLDLALRDGSLLGRLLKGRIRAAILTISFTVAAVTLLAWKAWTVQPAEFALLTAGFVLSAAVFSTIQRRLLTQLHQPFARSFATSAVTWMVAVPLGALLAWCSWSWTILPGAILRVDLAGAVGLGLSGLPERSGLLGSALSIPATYEMVKLWALVQLRDHGLVIALYCLDSALIAFVLCRSAVLISQFIEEFTSTDP